MLSHKECIEILKKNEVPRRIFLHCRKVNAVATLIANKISENGIKLNVGLIDNASLLHDVKKLHEIEGKGSHEEHEEAGKKVMDDLGEKELGEVILTHKTKSLLDKKVDSWEKKIVHYADKRVKHEEIVDIHERLRDGQERYKDNPHHIDIDLIKNPLLELEKEIFNKAGLKPEDITEESIKPFLIEDEY